MTGEVAILRCCRRCGEWRSIEKFKPLAKLCCECAGSGLYKTANRRIAKSRAIAITPKGRAALRDMEHTAA